MFYLCLCCVCVAFVFVDLDDVDFCLLMYNQKVLGEVILDWIINDDGDDGGDNAKRRRRPTTPMNF